MKTVAVRNVVLGEGRPKICVPIMGGDREAIFNGAREIKSLPADIAEWRADGYEDVFQPENVREILAELREILGGMPLLFTFRTIQEGGEKGITGEQYLKLLSDVCKETEADMVDVELFMDGWAVKGIIENAHEYHKRVIMSNHDFIKTPDKDEIIRRLILMDEAGGDILKIAVMPKKREDVLELLTATEEMGRLYTDKPLVTMSMGSLGMISRLSGETFGSVMTFGAGTKASAPGQIPAAELRQILDCLHGSRD